MNIEKFISKEEILIEKSLDNPSHIALCFDKNYAIGAGVLITSIIANNPNLDFNFHLFALSIDDDDKKRLKKIKGKTQIILYHIDPAFNEISYASKSSGFPISASLRLIAPQLLKNKAQYILYLDCDMLCTGKLNKLFEIDLSNRVAACVLDISDVLQDLSKNIGLPDNNYFNSGMLYINTKKWCEERVTEKSVSRLGKICYKYPDQDILNIVLNGKVLIIDDVFNYLCDIITKHNINYFGKTHILNEVIFFHFLGTRKPWLKLFMNSTYKKYFKTSPVANKKIKFSHDNHPSNIMNVSNELRKNKHYLASLQLTLVYYLNKFHIINSFK